MRNNSLGKQGYRFLCAILDLLLCSVGFFAFWYPFVAENNATGNLTGLANLLMAVGIFALLTGAFMLFLGGFRLGVNRLSDVIGSQIIAFFLADFMEILISAAITGQYRFWPVFLRSYLILFLAESAVVTVLTWLLTKLYRKLFPPLRILEIDGPHENGLGLKFDTRADCFHIARRLDCSCDGGELRERIPLYDGVLLNDLPSKERNKLLKLCFELDRPVYFTPKLSDILVKSSENFYQFDTPIYYRSNVGMTKTQSFVKRFLDILLSAAGFVVLSPLLLLTAVAIKLEDGGPVLFRQKRATLFGEEFWIYKFRSMIVHEEDDGKPHPASDGDARITRVGAVIRALRIDELPQLLNILKGDMSIVGPRPERLEHVKAYEKMIPEFVYRQKVKGGLTGYAQVYGKYNTTALDKIKMDLIYITNYSLLMDMQIMLETVKVLFNKESTSGFTEEQKAFGKETADD